MMFCLPGHLVDLTGRSELEFKTTKFVLVPKYSGTYGNFVLSTIDLEMDCPCNLL